jgi:hypothetical protein
MRHHAGGRSALQVWRTMVLLSDLLSAAAVCMPVWCRPARRTAEVVRALLVRLHVL